MSNDSSQTTAAEMHPVLAEIVELLDVECIEENLYRGQNHQTEHVFGGQVLAQAMTAAYRTVDSRLSVHSLHSYFLRAGDWKTPILFEVDRVRDGRSFATRRVVAIQHGRAIFNLSCSWHVVEDGLEHDPPMPDVPPPEALRSDKEVFEELARTQPEVNRYRFRFNAIDSRHAENIRFTDSESHPPTKHSWMRTAAKLPDNDELHLGLLCYMSDMDFMSTSRQPHDTTDIELQGASLDHAMWFHRPFRADEWMLFAKESPSAAGARGFVRGHFFSEAGELLATAAQECLIRPRPKA